MRHSTSATTAAVAFLALCTAPASCTSCSLHGQYQGSEDISLWRDGLAFVSSGLERKPGETRWPPTSQPGMMLALNLSVTDRLPELQPLQLKNMPAHFGFRPHGMHIDNVTNRVYTVSHSADNQEESIVVFDIVHQVSSSSLPVLNFRYALTSPNFTYYAPALTWFLNDLVAIDGQQEVLVTQFGPFNMSQMQKDKFLWRCTWDEAAVRYDGRLPAHCAHATEESSLGLNGINIDAKTGKIWVNDIWTPQLRLIDRAPNGTLTRRGNIQLPGNVDNVERDSASGDLTMGMFCDQPTVDPIMRLPCGTGGIILSKGNASGGDLHSLPKVVLEQEANPNYQVSSSLVYNKWIVLGSPWATGLIICQ